MTAAARSAAAAATAARSDAAALRQQLAAAESDTQLARADAQAAWMEAFGEHAVDCSHVTSGPDPCLCRPVGSRLSSPATILNFHQNRCAVIRSRPGGPLCLRQQNSARFFTAGTPEAVDLQTSAAALQRRDAAVLAAVRDTTDAAACGGAGAEAAQHVAALQLAQAQAEVRPPLHAPVVASSLRAESQRMSPAAWIIRCSRVSTQTRRCLLSISDCICPSLGAGAAGCCTGRRWCAAYPGGATAGTARGAVSAIH